VAAVVAATPIASAGHPYAIAAGPQRPWPLWLPQRP